jgi:hypothetical protein
MPSFKRPVFKENLEFEILGAKKGNGLVCKSDLPDVGRLACQRGTAPQCTVRRVKPRVPSDIGPLHEFPSSLSGSPGLLRASRRREALNDR